MNDLNLAQCPAPLNVRFESCYAQLIDSQLHVGNDRIQRSWQIKDGLLYATSLRDVQSGTEWMGELSQVPAPYPSGEWVEETRHLAVKVETGRKSPVEEPSLRLIITAIGARRTLVYHVQIFPGAAAVIVQLTAPSSSASPEPTLPSVAEEVTGIEQKRTGGPAEPTSDCLENFTVSPAHCRLIGVELKDQTDAHNELVFEREWLPQGSEWNIELAGNLFILENTLTGAGLLFLKQAPLPHARPVQSPLDFTLTGGKHCICLGHGADPAEGRGYPHAVVTYSGGRFGRTGALHQFQRQLRAYVPGRDGVLICNTWGDRSRDGRVTEEFVTREIEAAEKLGADVIQIDDGWQRGRSLNSAEKGGVWNGFWAADSHFWDPHPERFPHGLAELVARAKARGIQLGLWFAPDSSDRFANWQRDAERILELHRTLGINYIKIDGVKMHDAVGESRLHRLFDTVARASEGRVVFDLDVTAEVRPGYFGLIGAGPIFVENRYTDWHNYWPHQALRHCWKLAQYIDPLRLRMEFLNSARNTQLYLEDPLAPAAYPADYLFATTMFANPLGWFEASNLPQTFIRQAAPLIRLWREHRSGIYSGAIQPIGEAPDGTAWTGFLSVGPSQAYVLLFREYNPRAEYELAVPDGVELGGNIEILWGEGCLTTAPRKLLAKIPQAQRFIFARITG